MHTEEYKSKSGWIFRYNDVSGYQVIPADENLKHPPSTLFKYYGLNEYSVDAFLRNYLYGSHPEQLNDPLDCSYGLLDFDDPGFIFNLLNHGTLDNPDHPIEFITNEIRNPNSHLINSAKNLFKDLIFSKLGILSLTNRPAHELMWSYYSNHAGICIEFDYKKFGFKSHGPFPINYTSDFLPISVKNLYTPALYMTTLKTNHWKHEDEWRMLLESEHTSFMELPAVNRPKHSNAAKREFAYQSDSIVSVTLGFKFFNREFEWERNRHDPLALDITLNQERNDPKYNEYRIQILDALLSKNVPLFKIFPDLRTAKLIRCPITIIKNDSSSYTIRVTPPLDEST